LDFENLIILGRYEPPFQRINCVSIGNAIKPVVRSLMQEAILQGTRGNAIKPVALIKGV